MRNDLSPYSLCMQGDHKAVRVIFMNHVTRKQSQTPYILHVLEITRSIIDAFDTTRDSTIKGVFASTFQYNRVGNSCFFSFSLSLFNCTNINQNV